MKKSQAAAPAVKIKFCGLTRAEDIAYANALKPDYIGFVFARASRRFLSAEKAAILRRRLNPSIKAVGVFVDEAPEHIARLSEENVIDLIQLHGRETPAYLENLRRFTHKPVIQAFPIRAPGDMRLARESRADFLLLDAPRAGGGEVFDWRLIQSPGRPFFLAGGLTADNIGRAINEVRPYAIDVSSGIETGGVKDRRKMEELIRRIKQEREETGA